ncbi:MAG: archaetidylserine decarboxylase [Planctomycetota bacterium]
MRGLRGARPLPCYVQALPRRAVSRLLGHLGRLRLPPVLLGPLLGLYAHGFGVELQEMERPLRSYASFLDFFTRRLRPDLRPQPEDPAAVTAPADGRVHSGGRVARGTILQTKGVPYGVGDLLGGDDDFEGGTWLTTYLAPGDYHRFHWPFDAHVAEVRHLPGDLWPVHPGAVAWVPRLFATNERIVLRGEVAGGGAFAVAAVGALNVGSIRIDLAPRLRTNRGGGARRTWAIEAPIPVRRGEPMGHFEFGSALVLLLSATAGVLEAREPGTRLRVGEVVGRLTPTPVRPPAG